MSEADQNIIGQVGKIMKAYLQKSSDKLSKILLKQSLESFDWRCSVKKMFLKILQNSQENTRAGAPF